MKVMCETNDGFVISEKDLELRGTGDFFGTKQHGIPEFKIANLFEDMPVLKQVQGISMKIIADDPKLEKESLKIKEKKIGKLSEEALKLSGIKVDVIYIDPPYNTGNKDFVYNDNFVEKDDQFKHSK